MTERAQLPIACTLTPSAGAAQLAAWRAFNTDHLIAVERHAASTVATYANDVDTRARLEALVAAERTCCAFVEWSLEATGDALRVTATGAPDAVASLAFLEERS